MDSLILNHYAEIYHHGIKGMKWGVRRYQNKDGSLTNLGKKRMYRDQYDLEGSEKKERDRYVADANRWVKEDRERSRTLANETGNLARNAKKLVDDSIKNAPKAKIDLSSMSDKEMRDAINRAFLEKQYNDMFNPPQVSKGKEYASKILETAGSVLAVTSSALGVALAIQQLTGK